jgi:hypothetical protein
MREYEVVEMDKIEKEHAKVVDKFTSGIVDAFTNRIREIGKSESAALTMQDILKLKSLSKRRKLSDFELDAEHQAWCELMDAF